nr:DUF480 domain-containing protein [Oceanococcus sp. HetDA_MAG_MS8]
MSEWDLSGEEARVIAVLVEKSQTTPQYYPMTVNAITQGCNQKSARHPVMQLTQGETGRALNALLERNWVDREEDGGRVPRWRQQMRSQLLLKKPTQAVLTALVLRGPQTQSELQRHAQPLGGPTDSASMSEALDDLADRAQPLVMRLERAAGQKEPRWVHLLCGAEHAQEQAQSAVRVARMPHNEDDTLKARVAALEERVAALEAQLHSVTTTTQPSHSEG